MEHPTQVIFLGDSILKGVQLDESSGRYRLKNDMDIPAIEKEFGISVRNESHFGATVEKGSRLLERLLQRGTACDVLVMDFGGNECDVNWAEIAQAPERQHLPRIPLEAFIQHYRTLIRRVRSGGIRPVVTNLPPLDSERFFKWWCRDLDRAAVLRWLGQVENIYAWQERYSRGVEALAREEGVPLVDLRGAFLDYGHLERTLCADGTHPNSTGQALITRAFQAFGRRALLRKTKSA